MKTYVSQLGNRDIFLPIVVQQLASNGIKLPRWRKISGEEKRSNDVVFGKSISQLPSITIDEDKRVTIPKFLHDITREIEKGIETDGIFRISISKTRREELKKCADNGRLNFDSTNAIDLACLLKQFLRELPEPLIPTRLYESFLVANSFEDAQKREESLLLLCLLITTEQLNVLRFLMKFLLRVASHSKINRMDVYNLAVVIAPNLMPVSGSIFLQTLAISHNNNIVSTLINNADNIGLVPDRIMEKLNLMKPIVPSKEILQKCCSSDGLLLPSQSKKIKRFLFNRAFGSKRKHRGRPLKNEILDCGINLYSYSNLENVSLLQTGRDQINKRKAGRLLSDPTPLKNDLTYKISQSRGWLKTFSPSKSSRSSQHFLS